MPSLADLQSGIRDAVINGDFESVTPLLVGGRAPEHRLAIHRRHYEASLITALLDKFPGTTWLVGSPFIAQAARLFVSKHPPGTPCIAEYGEDFPGFLARCEEADRVPYVREFAELEWHIGHVAIAIDEPALTMGELSAIATEGLPDTALTLQSGLRYLRASWPIDELMQVYLAETRPDHFEFEPAEVWLEILGARGEFSVDRLGRAEFIFRRSVSIGRSIGESAEEALETDSNFDPGEALRTLLTGGLVVGIEQDTASSEQ